MKKLIYLCLIFLFTGALNSQASHLMGGEINYKCLGGNDYVLTLVLYRDCSGITMGTTETITTSSASCGLSSVYTLDLTHTQEVTPSCPGQQSTCNGGTYPGMELYVYQDTVTLGGACDDWTFEWSSCCRNGAITNLMNASSSSMYLSSRLDNLNAPCNSSPVIMGQPVAYVCIGNQYCIQNTAYDADGDSLTYSLADPLSAAGTPIPYNAGFSATNPFTSSTGISFDPTTGNLCWTPSQLEVGVVSIRVDEYRNGQWIGMTFRDMQIASSNCMPTVYSVNGTVLDTTGAPAPVGTWVELWEYNINAASMLLVRDTTVDANGDYNFTNLPTGQFAVRTVPNPLQLPNHATTYYVNTGFWETAVLLNTVCDTSFTADIDLVGVGDLLGSGSINGYLASYGVVTRSSYGAPDIDVFLLQNGEIVAHTRSHQSGNYSFTNVPGGNYTIKVDVPGLNMISTHNLTLIPSGTDVSDVDFNLHAGGIEATNTPSYLNTGVGELVDDARLSVYPNPSANAFIIDWTDLESTQVTVRVLDMTGRAIHTIQQADRSFILDLANQPSGTYLLVLEGDFGRILRQLHLQR